MLQVPTILSGYFGCSFLVNSKQTPTELQNFTQQIDDEDDEHACYRGAQKGECNVKKIGKEYRLLAVDGFDCALGLL